MATYYCVGTTFMPEDELGGTTQQESKKGRILLFSVAADTRGQKRLELRAVARVRGTVYTVEPFRGGLLAGINSRLALFQWVPRLGAAAAADVVLDGGAGAGAEPRSFDGELRLIAARHGFVTVLSSWPEGDSVLVGDIMRSMSLISLARVRGGADDGKDGGADDGTAAPQNPEHSWVSDTSDVALEEVCRDYNTMWTTATAMLDPSHYLAGENMHNLYCCRRDPNAVTDDERRRLEFVGGFHLGEFVNRFREGSLVMRAGATASGTGTTLTPRLVFGCVSGMIGVVASMSRDEFLVLSRLQAAAVKVLHGVGNMPYNEWRRFSSASRTDDARNFVDGDLVESILDMGPEDVARVLEEARRLYSVSSEPAGGDAGLPPCLSSAASLLKYVESASRATH